MEVIEVQGKSSKIGKYNEEKLLERLKEALEASKKAKGKVMGFSLKAFLSEVYSGEKCNLGALRKGEVQKHKPRIKAQEVAWKNNLGDIKVTIREKDDVIGFYLQK
jgi:regulatory protein YycI of two-component signal transduction system YycFG